MNWLQSIPNTLGQYSEMGIMQGDSYVVDEAAALAVLEDMLAKLSNEDQALRTFRRSIGFDKYIEKNLIPLMIFAKNEHIIATTIQLLVNLTLPIECLYSVDLMSRTEAGRLNISDICQLLTVNKKCFTDMRVIRAIVEYLRSILEKDPRLSQDQCYSINNCLLLLRNVLHIPEANVSGEKTTNGTAVAVQNQVLWNLFTLSIDKLLIHLMSCSQRGYFGVAMVQLIALMYKDQHISTLQKLLNMWFEASVSDSSEDFESNTTPLKQGSGNSSPMLTSDSSDNGGQSKSVIVKECCTNTPQTTKEPNTTANSPKNIVQSANSSISPPGSVSNSSLMNANEISMTTAPVTIDMDSGCSKCSESLSSIEQRKKSIISEFSDCGYGTQVENHELISTSSNEDDIPMGHQKPPLTNQKQRYNAVNNPRSAITIHDKKEWRRKKLVKRSKWSLINMKGLLHHTPSDEAISNILKEFTVDFLLKGYGFLVKDLHVQLLQQSEFTIQIDTSHFFWLITYFLKFTAQLELDLEHVKGVLSYDIISYLTFEGVNLCEELDMLSSQEGLDNKSCLRRLHLVVTSIKEFLQVMDAYKKISHLNKEDRAYLHLLTLQISASSDLYCLFVLLLRHYNAAIHTKQYLQDIVVTNHILLILLDEASKLTDYSGNLKMLDHIEQYATVEVMHKYGLLLADFQQNGAFVNDCIFTMMHHIGGDVGQIAALFQPTILKTFSNIFETEYDLCDDWSDLIEYIMHKFINTPQTNSLSLPGHELTYIDISCANNSNCCDTWTKNEIDTLFWYYVQCKKTIDVIDGIIKLFCNNGFTQKSRISVIQQLLQQDIIATNEYDDFMKSESVEYERNTNTPDSNDESGIFLRETPIVVDRISDDIQFLTERLKAEHKEKTLIWLQKTLVDCCFVKLSLKKHNNFSADQNIMEPVPLYYSLKHQSVPVVPWNGEQSQMMQYQPFMLLLHKLGFHLPVDSGKTFVRIPEFWTADILYNVAVKLGPVDRSLLRFDLSELTEHQHIGKNRNNHSYFETNAIFGMNRRNSKIRYTPDPIPEYTSNWLNIVHKKRTEAINTAYCIPKPSHYLLSTKTTSPDCIDEKAAAMINELKVSGISTFTHYGSKATRLPDVEELTDEDNAIDYENQCTSNCDTASVASDLTQMYNFYVSDEDNS